MARGSLRIRIEADIQSVERALRHLPDVSRKSIYRALNKTASSVRTQAKRDISHESGLRPGFINKKLKVHKANSYKLYADVEARTTGVLVSQLPGAKQTRTGISYAGAGKTVTIKHGFIHGAGVNAASYIRRHAESVGSGRPGVDGLVRRYPIRWLWAPNLVVIFGSRKLLERMEARSAEQWPKNIGHEVSYALSRIR